MQLVTKNAVSKLTDPTRGIKIRNTARLSVSLNSDTDGLKSGRQVAVRYYILH